MNEIEEIASVLHRSISNSPSEHLLLKWGLWGMTVNDLVQFLDRLHMERVLVHIRPPGDTVFQIVWPTFVVHLLSFLSLTHVFFYRALQCSLLHLFCIYFTGCMY